MGMNYCQEMLVAESYADGTALANTTTGASIIDTAAKVLVPGSFFDRVGGKLVIDAWGRISTVVTSPGTLTFEFRLGPTSNIIVATSPGFALNIVAKTNVPWWLHWELELRAKGTGTSANFMHIGQWLSEAVIGSPVPGTGGSGALLIPAATPAVGTGFDSTVDNVADLQAKWSVANAANSIQLHMYRVLALNKMT